MLFKRMIDPFILATETEETDKDKVQSGKRDMEPSQEEDRKKLKKEVSSDSTASGVSEKKPVSVDSYS